MLYGWPRSSHLILVTEEQMFWGVLKQPVIGLFHSPSLTFICPLSMFSSPLSHSLLSHLKSSLESWWVIAQGFRGKKRWKEKERGCMRAWETVQEWREGEMSRIEYMCVLVCVCLSVHLCTLETTYAYGCKERKGRDCMWGTRGWLICWKCNVCAELEEQAQCFELVKHSQL